jgi:hypothetical protein
VSVLQGTSGRVRLRNPAPQELYPKTALVRYVKAVSQTAWLPSRITVRIRGRVYGKY